MKIKDFVVPKSVTEACNILKNTQEDSVFIIAGGTCVNFMGDSNENQKIAVDISKLPFDYVNKSNESKEIGALVTLSNIMRKGEGDCVECGHKGEDWLLDQVANKIATQPVRNISTIGGNISRVFYWSDMPVALLALDGVIRVINIHNEVEEDISAIEFFKQQPAILLKNKKCIVKSVKIRTNPNNKFGMSYYKESKTHRTFSMMSLAVFVEVNNNSIIEKANVVLGACVNLPRKLYDIEKEIVGKNADELLKTRKLNIDDIIENIPNLYMRENLSKDYLKNLIKIKTIDCVCNALIKALK